MTRSDSRGIPSRPRPTRTENGLWTQAFLADWAHLVERAEAGIASHVTGCPQCDGDDGLDARDELEALLIRGGRRARRIAREVKALDDRFMRATTPSPIGTKGAHWWRLRNLD